MKKIPCLFRREFTARGKPTMFQDVTPGCEWVLAGEGVATQKMDGSACMVRGGKLFKRYDAKGKGEYRPPGWEPCEEHSDPNTGSKPGWVPVGDGPEDRWHREALKGDVPLPDGTYELLGPKVNGGNEGTENYVLMLHGTIRLGDIPLTFEGLREYLAPRNIEGIVWHHPDGRMVKLRKDDYGMRRVST